MLAQSTDARITQVEAKRNQEGFNTASIQVVSSLMIVIFLALINHRRSSEINRKQKDWNFSRAVFIPTKVKTI
jgi:hypothetical protein